MVILLCTLCVFLGIVSILLGIRLFSVRRAAEEVRIQLGERLSEDTNVGLTISTRDPAMKRLAAELDRQLKLLRKEHIRYVNGDKEVKNAITGISHDLRTPLTAICGYMELLSREEASDAVKQYLAIIENRVEALKGLSEELFRYSVALTAGSYETREEISLNSALEECIAGFYGALKEAGIEPEISLPETQVLRRLNGQALSRILSNIVGNAIKYSQGDFCITLKEDGTVTFSNRAEGLDRITVGHLFDRFYTVETGTHSTGLGLAIARSLTEEMQGKLDASCENGILTITLAFSDAG